MDETSHHPEGRPAKDLRFGGVRFDGTIDAFVDGTGKPLDLRPQSAQVLKYLAARADGLVTKTELFDMVWTDIAVTNDSLVQCVTDIRRVLGDRDRKILRTVPRKGYMLIADELPQHGSPNWRRRALVVSSVLIAATGFFWMTDTSEHFDNDLPEISIETVPNNQVSGPLEWQVRLALSRYRTVRLMSDGVGDYVLKLKPEDRSVSAELSHEATNQIIFVGEFPIGAQRPRDQGARLAAAIASPMSGAIARTRLSAARRKPVADLTRYECFLHGFLLQGNQNNDLVAQRTEACLDDILARDQRDARAWALKGALLAQQYWWGVGLDGPARSDQNLRLHLPAQALAAARRGDALLESPDSAVYYALARSYYSACEKEKTLAAARRAIEINPDDPNILGAAGNWIAYTGNWDEGVALAHLALEIEPIGYAKWWHWPIGKAAWREGDYDAALDAFMHAFDDNNWLSHLQLSYTLPLLGRLEEARASVTRLRELRPGMTRHDARTAYERWCFDPIFLDKMENALALAGLPDTK